MVLLKTFIPFLRKAIPLFVVLLLSVLSACRKAPEGPGLVLLTPGGDIRKGVEKVVARFREDNPGVKVQIITTPGKDYYVKSLTMLAGRADVDLLWMGQGFGMFASRGALLDLTLYVGGNPDLLEGFHPEVLNWYRLSDKLYGIPYGIDYLVIAYNKELFEQASLPYPAPDWTLEDLIAVGRKLQRVNPETGRTEVAGFGFSELDYRYDGLSLLNENSDRFALNTPAGLEWLRRNVTLLHDERLLQRGNDLQSMDRLSLFFSGKAAMCHIATWDIGQLRKQTPFRWDIVRLPKGKGGESLTWASSAGFSISRGSRHPDLAWKLLQYLVGPEFQEAMMESSVPVNVNLHERFLAAHPPPPEHLREFLALLDGLRPNPRIAAFQEVESEWSYWNEQALLRKCSPEEALKQAEANINRILELHAKETQP